MNFAFYVSGKAGRLFNILEWDLEVLKYTKLVVTDSANSLHIQPKLDNLNIPLVFFDYASCKTNNKNINLELSNFILDKFIKYNIDYCFCFGDHILKGKLLDRYKNKIINFHPSVLPLFPGRTAIDKALNSQSIILGNTAHFIDEGVDTGDILTQLIVPKETFYSVGYDGILNLQILLLMNLFQKLTNIEYDKSKLKTKLPNIEYFIISNNL